MADEEPRLSRGQVTTDPLADMHVGAELLVDPVVFGSSDAGAIPLGVTNWGFFAGAVLGVGFRTASADRVTGSAVMLAPGLAVTAQHVLADELDQLASGATFGYCFGVRGDDVDLWRFRSISHAAGDDIAFISLELMSAAPPGWAFRIMPLARRLPVVGDQVTVVGFRMPDDAEVSPAGDRMQVRGDLLAAAGTVRAVHRPRRDSVMITFPAVEIDCGALGGMSGGVVLNQHAVVIGVVSTSIGGADGTGPTYAALIDDQHLDRDLDLPWPAGIYPSPTSLRALRDGLLRGVHGERT